MVSYTVGRHGHRRHRLHDAHRHRDDPGRQDLGDIDVSGIVDDTIVEADETVVVDADQRHQRRSADITHRRRRRRPATVNIVDDDSATVSIASQRRAGERDADRNGQFTVSLTQAELDRHGGQLHGAGRQHGHRRQRLHDAQRHRDDPGRRDLGDIDVQRLVDDAIVEADETVIVTLTSVTSGDPRDHASTARADTATVTIVDDDSATVSIASQRRTAERDADDNGQFTVSLTQAELDRHGGQLHGAGGSTATGGSDYTTLSGTVTILAGQTSATSTCSGISTTRSSRPTRR